MANAKDQVLEIAKDLLNLEINTILSPSITGGKMPPTQDALRDIARWYLYALFPKPRDSRDQLQRLIEESVEGGLFKADATKKITLARVYDLYLRQAQARLTGYYERGESLGGSDAEKENLNLMLLFRISDASKQIISMLEALQQRTQATPKRGIRSWLASILNRSEITAPTGNIVAEFTSNELIQIRKIWEIGTDEIIMQTVVQLDGDVVTRIRPDHLTEKDEKLHRLHEYSVKLSVDFWKQLIDVLSEFFQNIAKQFFT